MNKRIKLFVANFSYTLSSNLISLMVSTLVVLIVPKLVGVEEYGYWQLYLFYVSYVGFLHLGWNDGIYLRYGGQEYSKLDKSLFFSQFYMLMASQFIIAILVSGFATLFVADPRQIMILRLAGVCLILTNMRHMLLFILQSTNRIKEYAKITMSCRILYFAIVIMLLLFGIRSYELMIVADLVGRLVSLIYAMVCCRDIVFRRLSTFYLSFQEMLININVGIKLMFANIASLLIIGIVRFGIQRTWDVATFGKVSLTLSVSNLMMVFINAVGIIIFPLLRRTNAKKLPDIYTIMRDFLMVMVLGILVVYYPARQLLSTWLPKYADSLRYMALLFPMFIYEGKMSLLIKTYLKTLRQEKMLLQINVVTVIISLVAATLTTMILENLDVAILSIVVLIAFRSVYAEFLLARLLKMKLSTDIFLEIALTSVFIISGWYIQSWLTMGIYALAYAMYLIIKRTGIISSVKALKALSKA